MPTFLVLVDVSFYEKTHSLSWFHHSLSKTNFTSIIINRLFDMWPLFNRAHFFKLVNVSKCPASTSYKNCSGFLSECFKVSLKFQTISILRHLNLRARTQVLKSTSQFIKDDFFTCRPAILHFMLRTRFCQGNYSSVHSLKGSRLRVTVASVRDAAS